MGNFFYLFIFLKITFFLFNPILVLKSNCITSRIENQNISIINCLIKDISSQTSGGAIYISKTTISLNINDTTFYQCISTNGNGGAIFFTNGLNIQLFKICALVCKANSHYQFAYLRTTSNQILDLNTINNCSNLNGYQTLHLENGNQNLSKSNISNNNNIWISGIWYLNPKSFFCNYCTFYNNTVRDYICIYLYGYSGTISKSNIILNNSPTNGVVSVYNSGNYILDECIFDQNQNILLNVITGTLKLNNCYINHLSNSITTNTINVPIFSPTLIITNTIYFFYSTYNCYYKNEELQTLNPTIFNTLYPNTSIKLYPSISYSFNNIFPNISSSESIFNSNSNSLMIYIFYIIIFIFLLSINLLIFIFLKNSKNEFNSESIDDYQNKTADSLTLSGIHKSLDDETYADDEWLNQLKSSME